MTIVPGLRSPRSRPGTAEAGYAIVPGHQSNGVVCAVVFSLSALLLWGGVTVWALSGSAYQHLYPPLVLKPEPGSWQLVEGKGSIRQEQFFITEPSRMGQVVLAIELPRALPAHRFDLLELASRGAEGRAVTISWSRVETFTASPGDLLEWVSEDRGQIRLGDQRAWRDDVYFLAVEEVGFAGGEWALSSVTLHPVKPDFPTLQRDLFGGWLSPQAWRQSDVNLIAPGRGQALASPVIAVAGWIVLSVLILVLVGFWKRSFNRPALILVPFVVGWLLLDLRWQADLIGKADQTLDAFAGLEPAQRLLADHDGQLYAFIAELQTLLTSRQVHRVFVFSPHEFWRKRARYHLAPWAARAGTEGFLSSNSIRAFEPGDVLVLLSVEHLEVRTADSIATELWFDGAPVAMDFEMISQRGSWYSVAVTGAPFER